MWKSEQHRMKPKYYIIRSFVLLVKNYFVTMEEDDNQFKITCKRCNGFVTCSVRSGELLYIIFIRYGFYNFGLNTEELDPDIFYFQWPDRTKIQRLYPKFIKKVMVIKNT